MLILLVSRVITACRPEKRVDACSIGPNPSLVKNRIMPLQTKRAARFAQRSRPSIKPRSCHPLAWVAILKPRVPNRPRPNSDEVMAWASQHKGNALAVPIHVALPQWAADDAWRDHLPRYVRKR